MNAPKKSAAVAEESVSVSPATALMAAVRGFCVRAASIR